MLKHNSYEEPTSHIQEHSWSEAFEHLSVGVAQLTLNGRLLTANESLCELLGRSKKDLLTKSFKEFFLPEGPPLEFDAGLARLIAGEIDHYSSDMSVVKTEGQSSWVNIVFSLVRENVTSSPRSMTAVARDITFLKQAMHRLREAEAARDELSRRMINAQDSDRARIARELHDDIGQSLAVLKIQMLRAGRPVSGNPQMMHASLEELAGRAGKIADKVGRLSHDLHSSLLEYLGLAVAVQGHCRDCSEKQGIPVHCCCDQLQDKLDSRIGLAFLRVLQEALQNGLKHSRATNITVALTSSGNELSLEISDDGVGFDMESAKLAAGLGLISMRERMHLIGGRFEIWSSPGRGTRIRVHVPIAS